jgi:hypothetical protein
MFLKALGTVLISDEGDLFSLTVDRKMIRKDIQTFLTEDRIIMDLELTENELFIATLPDHIRKEMDSETVAYLV